MEHKKYGTLSNIDKHGRVFIPKLFRDSMNITDDKKVWITYENDKIVIRKYILTNKDFLEKNYNPFINFWLNYYPEDTIIITNLSNIITAYGKASEDYLYRDLDNNIKTMINDESFEKIGFNKIKVCNIYEEKCCDVFALNNNNCKIGSLIIVHEDSDKNLDSNNSKLVYELLNKIGNNGSEKFYEVS